MAQQFDDDIAILAQKNLRPFLGPRPGKKSFDKLAALQLTHCCTLLSEREDARGIEKICQRLGCAWVWLPMEGGRLDVLRQTDIAGHIATLAGAIKTGEQARIYFHCSAGIHRTGFFVYVLLRLLGFERDDAVVELTNLRPVTAAQVGPERLDLADELVARNVCSR